MSSPGVDKNINPVHVFAGLALGVGLTFVAAPHLFSERSDASPTDLQSSTEPPTVQNIVDAAKAADPPPQEAAGSLDNANDTSVKSWTSGDQPARQDKRFLNSLSWKSYRVGDYDVRTGIIYGKWIAAMQFIKDGQPVLTEYTPPAEYVTIINPETGKSSLKPAASDPNHDGTLELIFLHQKLYDHNYHMYTVYALNPTAPKLLWKSGGELGDWLKATDDRKRSPARIKLGVD